jgi:hypothetical protein
MNVVSTMYPGLPNPNAAGSIRSTERVVVVSIVVCADNVSVETQKSAKRIERVFFMDGGKGFKAGKLRLSGCAGLGLRSARRRKSVAVSMNHVASDQRTPSANG